MCWPLSDGSSKLIPIDEESNDQIVHTLRLGKANRPTHSPLDPRPKIDVLALDLLGIRLAHFVRVGVEMPLVRPPAIRVKLRDAKGFQQLLQLQKDGVLPPSKHIRSHFPRGVINGVPQPTRIRFPRDIGPHFIELGAEATTHLQLIRPADFPLHLLGMQDCQHGTIHRLQLRLFF